MKKKSTIKSRVLTEFNTKKQEKNGMCCLGASSMFYELFMKEKINVYLLGPLRKTRFPY